MFLNHGQLKFIIALTSIIKMERMQNFQPLNLSDPHIVFTQMILPRLTERLAPGKSIKK